MKGFPYSGKSPAKSLERGWPSKHNDSHSAVGDDSDKAHDDPAFKQTDSDLKKFLMSGKGFDQKDADRMMSEGAYDLNNSEFKKWYAESSKGDAVSMKKKKKNTRDTP